MRRFAVLVNYWMVITILLLAGSGAAPVRAADPQGETLPRTKTITISYTKYKWWVIRWSSNAPLCTVFTDQENWPTGTDILRDCGNTIYTEWKNTQVCTTAETSGPTSCSGVYLHFISSEPAKKEIEVELPAPQVWLTLGNCFPGRSDGFCATLPTLVLTGEEPLPNERITFIHAVLNGKPYSCNGASCEITLSPTPLRGMTLDFWAESSFGDTSPVFTALLRVVDTGVTDVPDGEGWYVDVLSTQWKGRAVASCAQLWDVFPPVGGLPYWLTTPESTSLLVTEEPYQYLAGRLVAQGVVDASTCPAGGLLANGYADACGLEKALPTVQQWQNQFNSQILQTAKDTGVPGQVLKNVFAQESQFWPGAFKDPKEFGLGQITDNGAETLLLWNSSFYNQFCPLVLDKSQCERGYVYLSTESQAILRGALAVEARSDCPTCSAGLDLAHANFSIKLFAQTLLANCSQVSRIVYNATGKYAGSVVDYENLWRLTVANYHIGPGCLSYAVYNTWNKREIMDWAHISTNLTPPCQSAVPYVDKIDQ
jgi:hypothetical protein